MVTSDSVTVVLNLVKKGISVDVEVPLNISANNLVIALNEAYGLNINTTDIQKCYLKSENPIALLKGNKTLAEFGIRNGTEIYYTE